MTEKWLLNIYLFKTVSVDKKINDEHTHTHTQ